MIETKEKGRPTKYKRPSEAELAALYKTNTAKKIAELYGVSDNTVKGWIHYYRHKAPQIKEINLV